MWNVIWMVSATVTFVSIAFWIRAVGQRLDVSQKQVRVLTADMLSRLASPDERTPEERAAWFEAIREALDLPAGLADRLRPDAKATTGEQIDKPAKPRT